MDGTDGPAPTVVLKGKKLTYQVEQLDLLTSFVCFACMFSATIIKPKTMIHNKNTRYTVQAQGSYFFCSSLKASNSTLTSVSKIYVKHINLNRSSSNFSYLQVHCQSALFCNLNKQHVECSGLLNNTWFLNNNPNLFEFLNYFFLWHFNGNCLPD